MNPVKPSALTADERLAEIAQILAAGLSRMMTRQSRRLTRGCGDSFLDCAAPQSGHANSDDGGPID